mgnify:CR=1 FL=1
MPRIRADRCPGVVHPWPADDGGLVRVSADANAVTLRQSTDEAPINRIKGDAARATGDVRAANAFFQAAIKEGCVENSPRQVLSTLGFAVIAALLTLSLARWK